MLKFVSSLMNVMSILALTDIGVGEPPPGFGNFEKILKYSANVGLGVGVFGILVSVHDGYKLGSQAGIRTYSGVDSSLRWMCCNRWC